MYAKAPVSDPAIKKDYLLMAYGEPRGAIKIDGKNIPFSDTIAADPRIVCYGIRYILENYIDRVMTEVDFAAIDKFFYKHFDSAVGSGAYPYDRPKFRNLIGKKPPIQIYALEEGTVVLPHTPVYKIVAKNEHAEFVTFFETVLTMVWYPMSVATLSRCCRQMIENTFKAINVPTTMMKIPGADPEVEMPTHLWWIDYMLQDFGFRGCTSVEQSVVGGTAHLVNFKGSDTMSASFYSQFHLNNGVTTGVSIPASEHSVMTSYAFEKDAMVHIMKQFGTNVFAMVMDSYDYVNSLSTVFPAALKEYLESLPPKSQSGGKSKRGRKQRGGVEDFVAPTIALGSDSNWSPLYKEFKGHENIPANFKVVFRPDSGNPYLAVVQGLEAGLRIFGINALSHAVAGFWYIVTDHSAVIQGDGINAFTINTILKLITNQPLTTNETNTLGDKGMKEYIEAKDYMTRLTNNNWAFSPMSIAFGMGGGLLQKINRDTLNFATKLCYVSDDGTNSNTPINVMKNPITDPSKRSLPGNLSVKLDESGVPKVTPYEEGATDLLKLAYDGLGSGIQPEFKTFREKGPLFSAIQKKVSTNWNSLLPNIQKTPNISALSEKLSDLQNTLGSAGTSRIKQTVPDGSPRIVLIATDLSHLSGLAAMGYGGGKARRSRR